MNVNNSTSTQENTSIKILKEFELESIMVFRESEFFDDEILKIVVEKYFTSDNKFDRRSIRKIFVYPQEYLNMKIDKETRERFILIAIKERLLEAIAYLL